MTPLQCRDAIQKLIAPHNVVPQLVSSYLDALAFETMCEMALAARPPSLRTESSQNITSGTAEYKLPSNFFLPIAILSLDGTTWGRMTKVTQEELDDIERSWPSSNPTSGGPLYYYESGVYTTNDSDYGKREITLWPSPTTSVTSGLKTRYLRRPSTFAAVTDSLEIVDFDAAHHFGIVYRTAWKILIAQGSKVTKVLDAYDAMWQTALSNLKKHHSEDWLYDYEPTVKAWRGMGLDRPSTR